METKNNSVKTSKIERIFSPSKDAGIYSKKLKNGAIMVVDMNFNAIRVSFDHKNPITYHYPDGIKISDLQTIEASHGA